MYPVACGIGVGSLGVGVAARFFERDLGFAVRLEVVLGDDLGAVGFVTLLRFRLGSGVMGSAVFRFRPFLRGVWAKGLVLICRTDSSAKREVVRRVELGAVVSRLLTSMI